MSVYKSTTSDNSKAAPKLDGARSQLEELLFLRYSARDLNIYSRRYSRSHLVGQQKTMMRGRGMEFEEVRQYQPGDDVRNIDWRVTARTQIPHTKLYREERERPVLIISDLRAPMFFGSQSRFKSVQLANVASLLSWAALQHKDRVGALIFDSQSHHDIRPARSKNKVMQMLQRLCEVNNDIKPPISATGDNKLADMLMDVRRVTRPGSAVFILSDFHDFDDASEAQLHMLARHNDVSAIKISDPMETKLPQLSGLSISDGKSKATLNRRSKQQVQFAQLADQRQEQLLQACRKSSVELISINTGDDPIAFMNNRFNERPKARAQRGRPNA